MPKEKDRLPHTLTAPFADSIRVGLCDNPRCHFPHVLLIDEKGVPFAQFVVPNEDFAFHILKLLCEEVSYGTQH